MYIRRTTIKSRSDGSPYFTYRLVESRHTEKGVRQHTLLNLGADFSLPKEKWPELTKRIEEILSGQQSLFAIDRDIEKMAQSYSAKIIDSYQDVEKLEDDDFREVNLDNLEVSRPRSIGAEHATLEALRLLNLDHKLKELGFNGPQTAAAIGTIIGRCCMPGSELATHAWLQERSGLGELKSLVNLGRLRFQACRLWHIKKMQWHRPVGRDDLLAFPAIELWARKRRICSSKRPYSLSKTARNSAVCAANSACS